MNSTCLIILSTSVKFCLFSFLIFRVFFSKKLEFLFFTDGETVLSDSETSLRLKKVPQVTKDLYGDEYFAEYINSVSRFACDRKEQESDPTTPLISGSKTSTPSSGYSTFSSQSSLKKDSSNSLKNRKNKIETSTDQKTDEFSKKRSFSTLSSSASASLKSSGQVNLTNTNRVLHALVEAVTCQSPKVRYFVGTFHDRMVKIFSPMMPTVVVDYYFTSGEISKVVPRQIKEKVD